MEQLMEERSDAFYKIDKVNKTEIAQLKRLQRELEEKVEEEIYEAIRLKEINTALQEQVEALQKERNSLQEALILQEANLKKELREYEENAVMLE
jgi:seryl-tRNA synthetase